MRLLVGDHATRIRGFVVTKVSHLIVNHEGSLDQVAPSDNPQSVPKVPKQWETMENSLIMYEN